jgi:hypothetical protein
MNDMTTASIFLTTLFLLIVTITYISVRRVQIEWCVELILKKDYGIVKGNLLYKDRRHNVKIYETLTEGFYIVCIPHNSGLSNVSIITSHFNTNLRSLYGKCNLQADTTEMILENIFLIETK